MSAATSDRQHARSVEMAMEGLALVIEKADVVDAKEDDLLRRLHIAVHRLDALDKEEDAAREEIASTFRELAGLLERQKGQMRLGEVA